MINQLRNLILLILFVTLSGAGIVACSSNEGGSSTTVGNPAATEYTVDATKVTYSAVSSGSMTITAESDFIVLGSSLSQSDVTITLKVNGETQKTLTESDFGISGVFTNLFFSATVAATIGDEVQVVISVASSDTGTTVLSGTAATTAGSPTANAAAAGLSALEDRNVDLAQEIYCNAAAALPEDSTLAFGCFSCNLFLLPETPEAAILLADFDEPAVDSTVTLFDTGGLFDRADDIHVSGNWPLFNYTDFNLPFATTFTTAPGFVRFSETILQIAITNGFSTADLTEHVVALRSHFETLETYLTVALNDEAFAYAFPAELFYLSEDVTVTINDLKFLMSGLKLTTAGLTMAEAYDTGVEASNVIQNGEIVNTIFLEDLNGSGATVDTVTVDTVSFLTLLDAPLVAAQETAYTDALSLLHTALSVLVAGETSQLLNSAIDQYDLERGVAGIAELQQSLSEPTQLRDLGAQTVTLSMRAFFDNPPDAAALSVDSGDPFVMEDGKITLVESYFEDLLDGIAEF